VSRPADDGCPPPPLGASRHQPAHQQQGRCRVGRWPTRGTVVEVKDVTRLSSSAQLRDLVGFAREEGVPLEIFTNATLPGSGQLHDWIRRGHVIISPL
jgi:hypothetical protein